MAKTFYVLDGHYQIYRSFYGLPQQLSSPSGEPTGATHGFCMTLFNLIRDRRPDYFAVALDVSDETVFRRDLDPAYKANREPAAEALHIQADRIISIIQALNIPVLRVPGFEADDVMATLAYQLRGEDIDLYLVSRDKDLDQLITDRVRLLDPVKGEIIDAGKLMETKGYTPEQAVEIQSLVGDSTDNVPGVPGVGPKTAVKLISQYGTAEAVIAHADEQTPKLAERLKEFALQLPITRQLVTLRRDTPIDIDLAACALQRLTVENVRPIFDELGFTTVRETLNDVARLLGLSATTVTPTMEGARRVTTLVDRSTYELVDSPEALDRFTNKLEQQSIFAFDTETTGLNPIQAKLVGISFAWRAGEGYYLPILGAMGSLLPLDLVIKTLKPIFENPYIRKVGHNLKYDVLVLKQQDIEVRNLDFDTVLASFLLEPLRPSHSLDALVKSLIGHDMIPITDLIGKGRDQITMDQVDTRRACDYAAEDADFTWRLYEYFAPQMAGSHVEPLFRDTEMPLIEVLVKMEHNGIALDTKLLAELSRWLEDRLIELTRSVHVASGHSFNIDSTKQLATVLFDEQGFSPVRKTKTGRSTDAETLEALAAQSDHPIPRLLLEYRELSKLKSTYVDTLPRMISPRTGRVHTSFNQIGAVTGRLSSNDPNLQNIPIRTETGRRIRQAVIAGDPDSVLLSADYSQIELRLLAHFSGDAALRHAFQNGQDIHRAVAAQVHNVPLEAVTSAQRGVAKTVNFGIIYGQTPFGLSRTLGIPLSEAKAFIDLYFQRYPGIRRFIDQCIESAQRMGYAETILGRRRPIMELQSRNPGQRSLGERLAINSVVQGSAADLIKKAMIDVQRELKTDRHRGKMLIQVHDELVFEVAQREVGPFGDMVREKMQHPIKLEVPIVVDIRWGRNWAEGK